MGTLSGKVAIVTGGSRGIGRSIAVRLAKDGASVAVSYNNSPDDANQTVKIIEKNGGKAVAIKANVGKVAEVRSFFEAVDKHFGGQLDILVNNAGVASGGALESITEEEFDRVFSVNVKGMLFSAQEAIKRLKSGGRIINITSSSTYFPTAGLTTYTASKTTPHAFTKVWAKELGGRGITVNGVAPGATVPGMFENAPPGVKEMAEAGSPFKRLGHADEIGAVVSFLCSDDASWISGQDILTNGAGTN